MKIQVLLNISKDQTAKNYINNVSAKTLLIVTNHQTRINQITSPDNSTTSPYMNWFTIRPLSEAKHLGCLGLLIERTHLP